MKKEEAEERLKIQEVTCLEAGKDERDLSVDHKRQLDKMLEDNRQGMQAFKEDVEEKGRDARKCRQLRQEVNSLTEQVTREKKGQADLAKHLLKKEQKKRTVLMGAVDTWKDNYEIDKITYEKEERLMNMKRDLAETAREKQTLVKLGERGDVSNIARMEQQRHDLDKQLKKRTQDFSNIQFGREELSGLFLSSYLSFILFILTSSSK